MANKMDQLVKLVSDNPGSTSGELYMLGAGREGTPSLYEAAKAGLIIEGRGGWNINTETKSETVKRQQDQDEFLRDLLAITELMIRSLGPVPRSPAAPKAAPAKVERPETINGVPIKETRYNYK